MAGLCELFDACWQAIKNEAAYSVALSEDVNLIELQLNGFAG
jgi:hypothetical protein